jgi:hypothetical protein
MVKSSISDAGYFHTSIKNSVKSKWFALLILFPLSVYIVAGVFETDLLTHLTSLFSDKPHKSAGFYRDLLQLISQELLWNTALLLLAWVFVVYVPLLRVTNTIERSLVQNSRICVFITVSLSFTASVVVADRALLHFPNSSDEYAYLYQARTMGSGKLWERGHDLPEFFYFNHIAQKDSISVGRFPPGWPLLLSVAYFTGIPAHLINPILGLITLLVFYSFASRFYNRQVALWSLIALALSSFYIFNAASYFSHTSCALFTLVFVYGTYLHLDTGKKGYALMAGLCLGLVAITRYYTAVLVFVPFFVYLLYRLRLRAVPVFILLGIGSLPCIAFLFWYNNAITGNPLVPVTMWAYADESLGFVRGHSVAKGFEHVGRWILMFFYWCSASVLVLYGVAMCRKLAHRKEWSTRPEDYIFILLMVGYFFYYQIGGNQYGPRFLFEAFPFVVLMSVNMIFRLREKWAMALFMAGIIFAAVRVPSIAYREHLVIEERNDIYTTVKEEKISHAVVLVSSYTGVIRPMPIGDLTRNDIHYANDVLYAQDLGDKNSQLMQYYPDRTFYKYVRNREAVKGRLVRVR